jgi:hypothetical protein
MRSLGQPFEEINEEQLILRVYNRVSPIDAAHPSAASVTVPSLDTLSLSVQPVQPAAHALTTAWYVDGTFRSQGNALAFQTAGLGVGSSHSVTAVTADPTAMVRQDPAGLVTDSRTWSVSIGPPTDTDADGVGDRVDNCRTLANGDQRDADADGYGNICDADLDNSGFTTASDFNLLRSVVNKPASAGPLAAAADMNGSGLVTSADFNLLRARINTAPGPSGLHP